MAVEDADHGGETHTPKRRSAIRKPADLPANPALFGPILPAVNFAANHGGPALSIRVENLPL